MPPKRSPKGAPPLIEQWLSGKPMRVIANYAQENLIREQIKQAISTYDQTCGQYVRLAVSCQGEAADAIQGEHEHPMVRGQAIGYSAGIYRAAIAMQQIHHWFMARTSFRLGKKKGADNVDRA